MIPTVSSSWSPRLLWLWGPQLIGAAGWWYLVSHVLAGRVSFVASPLALILMIIGLGVVAIGWWLGSILFGAALIPQRSWRILTAGVSSVPLWFFFPFSLWTGITWLVVLAGVSIGLEQAHDHAHNSLLVRVRQVLGVSLGLPLLAVMIGTSLLYYQQLRTSTKTPDILANNVIDQAATTVERLLPNVRSEYRLGMTVDELLGLFIPKSDDVLKGVSPTSGQLSTAQQNQLKQQLSDRGVPVEQLDLDFSQTEAQLRIAIDAQIGEFRAEIIKNLRTELSRTLRIDLRGDETVQEALKGYFGRQFNTYIRDYLNWLPPLLALALFFTLRLVSIIFQWGIIVVGWAWYRLLRLTRILGVVHETVPAERLSWNS